MLLYQKLKEKTSSSHRELEKQLVIRIKNLKSIKDYVVLLKMMYGYYSSMENVIETHLCHEPAVNFNERRKASWLINDIRRFNHNTDDLRTCGDLPMIKSQHGALGAMYVLEGSTLGGQMIATLIQHQLNINSDEGFNFFRGYGSNNQNMWEQFKENLNKPFDSEAQEEIIATANSTFVKFKNWVNEHAVN